MTLHPAVVTIYGVEGSIKSTIAITWPGSKAFYDLEGGGHRAWGFTDMVKSGEITIRDFDLPHKSLTERNQKLSGYEKAWTDFTAQLLEDFANFDNVIWDTGTLVWALDRDCMLEQVQREKPTRKNLIQIEYAEPNRRINELYNLSRAFQTNLIVTHHETDEYMNQLDPNGKIIVDENNIPVSYTTGKKVPDGFKHTKDLSDWVIHTHELVADTDGAFTPRATVDKSAYGFHHKGTVIDWPCYDKLDALVNPPGEEKEEEQETDGN